VSSGNPYDYEYFRTESGNIVRFKFETRELGAERRVAVIAVWKDEQTDRDETEFENFMLGLLMTPGMQIGSVKVARGGTNNAETFARSFLDDGITSGATEERVFGVAAGLVFGGKPTTIH
jgi:hypothetical protein